MSPIILAVVMVVGQGVGARDAVAHQSKPPLPLPVDADTVAADVAVATADSVWSVIFRSHPDTGFNGVDWAALRPELRRRAGSARTNSALRAVIQSALDSFGQSHFRVLRGEELQSNRGSIGAADAWFDVRLIDDAVVVFQVDSGGPAALAGVRPGWVLVSVDTVDMATLVRDLSRQRHHQRLGLRVRNRVRRLLAGAPGSSLALDFRDGLDQPSRVLLRRAAGRGTPATYGNLPTVLAYAEARTFATPAGGDALYLRFNYWMFPILAALDSALDANGHAQGVIIDLRGNVGGVREMVIALERHFVAQEVTTGTMMMRGGAIPYIATPRTTDVHGRPRASYAGPVVALVDEISSSGSENFAGSMQALGRLRVVGQRTAGQVLPSQTTPLPNGDVLIHGVATYVTSTGKALEGTGVVPDETVPLRRADLLADRDSPLEAALAWIDAENQARKSTRGTTSPMLSMTGVVNRPESGTSFPFFSPTIHSRCHDTSRFGHPTDAC